MNMFELREARKALGYKSQEAFAQVLGVSRATYANWERGAVTIPKYMGFWLKGQFGYNPHQRWTGVVVNAWQNVTLYIPDEYETANLAYAAAAAKADPDHWRADVGANTVVVFERWGKQL